MNAFDASIQTWLVHFAASSVIFTHAVHAIADLYLVKVIPLAILWAIWFRPGERQEWRREMVIATLLSGFVAFVLGRLLALYLPFRLRPIYDPNIHLTFTMTQETGKFMRLWSSFPSDHAALWMAIAIGIFLVWRWIGALAILHCVFFICLPRVYVGLHYPTDVIAGAAIGALCACILTRAPLRTRIVRPLLRFMNSRPAVGYMLAFLFFFELATMFDEPRAIAVSLVHAL